jgi:hypothetical protein
MDTLIVTVEHHAKTIGSTLAWLGAAALEDSAKRSDSKIVVRTVHRLGSEPIPICHSHLFIFILFFSVNNHFLYSFKVIYE